MYYTGLNPFTLEPVHVPKGWEKKIQRALMQYREPQNRGLVLEGLKMAGQGRSYREREKVSRNRGG